jgi:calcineurin-like phosphoesterase family protein
MIYFTADHHFGHTNIIKYVSRPFKSVEIMDSEMISRWNEVVKPDDTVYHLGDFTLGNKCTARNYFKQLNGNIFVVPGGHDKRWIDAHIENVVVLPKLYMTNIGGLGLITMCHYPMYSWERSHYGSLHLHGHCHGTIGMISCSGDINLPPRTRKGSRIDVGVDNHDFYPINIDRIREILGERQDRISES